MRLSKSSLSCAAIGVALLGATACAPVQQQEPFPEGTPQPAAATKTEPTPAEAETPAAVESPVAGETPAVAESPAEQAKADAKADPAKKDEAKGKDALVDNPGAPEPVAAAPKLKPVVCEVTLTDEGIKVDKEVKLGNPITLKITNKSKGVTGFKIEGLKGKEVKEIAVGKTVEMSIETGPGILAFTASKLSKGKECKINVVEK